MASDCSPSNFCYSTSFSYLDSPPSLVFSERSCEDFEEPLHRIMDREDVSAVMAKVLGHLHRVAEHLRQKEENDAANEIAKQSINMVNAFNDATASWDIEKCLMDTPAPLRSDTETARPASDSQSNRFFGGTWAAVAATATETNNRLVKFRPSDALKRNITDEKPSSNGDDLRVVWVQPWTLSKALSSVTERLSYGPLLSMAYSEADNAVCIIFQHPYQAQHMLHDNSNRVRSVGHGLFGAGCQVLPGQAYAYNEDLQRMEPPHNERRRLTFARQQLFTHGMSEEQFKKDIYAVVGEHNVELVWLFNTGNATVVFSATVIARLIRDEFRSRARKSGPYKDIQVTFSHDPCERPMNLITQLPGSRDGSKQGSKPVGTGLAPVHHAVGTPLGTNLSTRRGSSAASAPIIDNDGWQTVARRR